MGDILYIYTSIRVHLHSWTERYKRHINTWRALPSERRLGILALIRARVNEMIAATRKTGRAFEPTAAYTDGASDQEANEYLAQHMANVQQYTFDSSKVAESPNQPYRPESDIDQIDPDVEAFQTTSTTSPIGTRTEQEPRSANTVDGSEAPSNADTANVQDES